ncbi:MAG: DUF5606 domain-containing protein [Bacteroidia bacterium]|nr:DUF5606 domain-containing protein [Bacteroidia bacterium]
MSEKKKIKLDKIIAISGEPGLYKIISSSKAHVIVENLVTKQRTSISALTRISNLADISMYVQDGEKPLAEIYYTLFEKTNNGPAISHKADDKEIIKEFESILPDYDKERVYVSNMRKFFNWYNILQQTGNLQVAEDEKTSEAVDKKQEIKSDEPKTVKKSTSKTKNTEAVKTKSGGGAPKKTTTVRKTGG